LFVFVNLLNGEVAKMAKTAKGKQPIYFDNPHIDKLLAIVMALTGEVSVLRERLDTIERLLETKGNVSIAEIESYQADENVTQQREQWRDAYLERVLRVLQQDLEALNQK
jgi:hypothetical protein